MTPTNSPNPTYRIISGLLLVLCLVTSCAEAATPKTEATPPLVSAAEAPPAIPTIAPTAEPTATPIVVPAASAPAPVGCTRGTVRTEDEIVIGALYPLSNPQMMANGFAMLAATNLAIADINERGGIGGKTIRAVIYDSASDPAQGALFAERLITLDCVTAIVGIFHSDVAIAVKDVAVQYHVPVIFADPYADEVTADWAPEIFRIAPTHSMLIETMGEWLNALGDYNRDGERLAVVIAENTEFGRSRLQRFEETLPQVGVKTVGFPIDLPSDDFSPVIARIVALDNLPDAIFLYLHNGNVMSLAKQLIDAGIGPERNSLLVTTSKILDDQRFWQEVPNGDFLIAMQIGPWPSTITQMGQSFAMRFQQYFHRWPEGSAFEAYDAVWLIADAIGRADSLVPNAIIDALEKTDITLAAGHYNFPYGSSSPPDAQGVAPYLWHQWPTPPILYLQYTETNQLSSQMQVIWPPAYSNGSPPIAPKLKELIDQIGFHR